MEINTPIATRQAGGSSESLTTESRPVRQEFTPTREAASVDRTRRVPALTPLPSDALERVEGIARWGLNE